MYDYRKSLSIAVSAEAKAYGFTLVVWTTGAVTIAERGLPGVAGAFAYLGGILVAQTIVVFAAFGTPRSTWRVESEDRRTYGAIHVASVVLAVLSGWGLAAWIPDRALAYLVAGFTACVLYQLLLALEIALSVVREEPSDASVNRDPRP